MSGRARTAVAVVLAGLVVAAGALGAATLASDEDRPQTGPGSTPVAGIDADTVRIGYLQRASTNWVGDPGDPVPHVPDAIDVVVAHLAEQGSAGGRRIEVVQVPFDLSDFEALGARRLCTELTVEREVFAVILHDDVRLPGPDEARCYAEANTIVVDHIGVHDQAVLDQLAPYVWAPSRPPYDVFLQAQLGVLRDEGFLAAGQRVQLIVADNDVARRVTESVAEPFLTALDVEAHVGIVDGFSFATIGSDLKSALREGKAAGAERALVVGGARLFVYAASDFETRDHPATWSATTFDGPSWLAENPDYSYPQVLDGMVGLGFDPLIDAVGVSVNTVAVADLPAPSSTRLKCLEIFQGSGLLRTTELSPAQLESAAPALAYCESLLLLAEALDNAGGGDAVTAQDFAGGVAELGDSLPSATAIGSSWAPGRYAAVDTVRALRWADECSCFEYFGPEIDLYR